MEENEYSVTRNETSVVMLREGVRLFLGDEKKTVTLSDGQKVVFRYNAADPEEDLKLLHGLVRTADADRLNKYKNDSFPPDTWQLVDKLHIVCELDKQYPDDIDLQCSIDANVYSENKELHYCLEYTYPDPWDPFFFCELGGEISPESFKWIAKKIGNREYGAE